MNYSKVKKDELKAICKERRIKGITGKSKEELVKMIENTDVTPVSAPKIEHETDVKVEHEMSEYTSIIQKALDADSIDYSCLSQKNGSICIKDELDVITTNITKSWAPLKATIVSIVAKLRYPDWDTRNHQTQIGGKYSLRTIDSCNVANYLFKKGLYSTATEFALTRSFEKAEAYTKSYTGNISPKVCKSAFLNIVEVINTTATTELLNAMLTYLIQFLKVRNEKNDKLKNSTIETSKELNLLDVSNVLEQINTLGSGISVVPVIVVHTLLSIIQPHLWSKLTIKNLKEHTAPDNHSKSYGDVEGLTDTLIPMIAIEVKHKIPISESIVSTFDKKTNETNIPLKFIITTAKTSRQYVKNNICIDSLTSFTTSYLQQVLFFENTICSKFIKELRTNIVNYTNISIDAKESLNEILTSLLVSASP
jgi:hypothetical protein